MNEEDKKQMIKVLTKAINAVNLATESTKAIKFDHDGYDFNIKIEITER